MFLLRVRTFALGILFLAKLEKMYIFYSPKRVLEDALETLVSGRGVHNVSCVRPDFINYQKRI